MADMALSAVFSLITQTLKWCEAKENLRDEVEIFREQIEALKFSLDFLMKEPNRELHPNLINLLGMLKEILTEACECCEKLEKKSKKVWNMKPKKQLAKLARLDKRLKNVLPPLQLALAGTEAIVSNTKAPAPSPAPASSAPSGRPRRRRPPPRRPTNMRAVSKTEQAKVLQTLVPSKFIFDPKALEFWTKNFGNALQAPSPKMMKAFSHFHLDFETKNTLRLWIDADGDGECTINEFASFLEQFGGLEKAIAMAQGKSNAASVREADEEDDKKVDCNILWVGGDANEDNVWYANEARKNGFKVLCLETCEAAIDLLEQNLHLLHSHDDKKFRIITNNVNYREGTDMVNKGEGGASESLIKFLRRRRSTVPILVYCNYTLPIAIKFTQKYKKTWATNVEDTAEAFLNFKALPTEKVSQY